MCGAGLRLLHFMPRMHHGVRLIGPTQQSSALAEARQEARFILPDHPAEKGALPHSHRRQHASRHWASLSGAWVIPPSRPRSVPVDLEEEGALQILSVESDWRHRQLHHFKV